jgi:hypothetical protein
MVRRVGDHGQNLPCVLQEVGEGTLDSYYSKSWLKFSSFQTRRPDYDEQNDSEEQ